MASAPHDAINDMTAIARQLAEVRALEPTLFPYRGYTEPQPDRRGFYGIVTWLESRLNAAMNEAAGAVGNI